MSQIKPEHTHQQQQCKTISHTNEYIIETITTTQHTLLSLFVCENNTQTHNNHTKQHTHRHHANLTENNQQQNTQHNKHNTNSHTMYTCIIKPSKPNKHIMGTQHANKQYKRKIQIENKQNIDTT